MPPERASGVICRKGTAVVVMLTGAVCACVHRATISSRITKNTRFLISINFTNGFTQIQTVSYQPDDIDAGGPTAGRQGERIVPGGKTDLLVDQPVSAGIKHLKQRRLGSGHPAIHLQRRR